MKNHLIVAFNGISGEASFDRGSIVLKGPWASHTGYYNLQAPVVQADESVQALLYATAESFYEKSKVSSFAVADEGKEYGWLHVRINYKGDIEVRLPSLHKGIVSDVLEQYGMVHTCKHNMFWAFPAGSGVSLETAKAFLEPITRHSTRFANESDLALNLDGAAASLGFSYRKSFSFGPSQQVLL